MPLSRVTNTTWAVYIQCICKAGYLLTNIRLSSLLVNTTAVPHQDYKNLEHISVQM